MYPMLSHVILCFSGGIVGVKHAMLLANTKFLAMCGR